jgi:hypothetical protein
MALSLWPLLARHLPLGLGPHATERLIERLGSLVRQAVHLIGHIPLDKLPRGIVDPLDLAAARDLIVQSAEVLPGGQHSSLGSMRLNATDVSLLTLHFSQPDLETFDMSKFLICTSLVIFVASISPAARAQSATQAAQAKTSTNAAKAKPLQKAGGHLKCKMSGNCAY